MTERVPRVPIDSGWGEVPSRDDYSFNANHGEPHRPTNPYELKCLTYKELFPPRKDRLKEESLRIRAIGKVLHIKVSKNDVKKSGISQGEIVEVELVEVVYVEPLQEGVKSYLPVEVLDETLVHWEEVELQ